MRSKSIVSGYEGVQAWRERPLLVTRAAQASSVRTWWLNLRGDLVWDTMQPNSQPRRCPDTSRASAVFGFHARRSFEEELRRTLDWYENGSQNPICGGQRP